MKHYLKLLPNKFQLVNVTHKLTAVLYLLFFIGTVSLLAIPKKSRSRIGKAPVFASEKYRKYTKSKSRFADDHPFSVSAINLKSKAAVTKSYHEIFKKYIKTKNQWTGSTSSCTVGRNSEEYNNATLIILNYFRAMAGLSGNVLFRKQYNNQAMHAALIMEAKEDLSHYPPKSWPCYSKTGADGAGSSNLCLGCTGPYAIEAYVDDSGVAGVGHRNHVFFPGQRVMGTGSTQEANALYVYGEVDEITKDEIVKWPPEGYVPYEFGLNQEYPWSFNSYGQSYNLKNAKVSMSYRGKNIKLRPEEYYKDMLVWYPVGVPKSSEGYGPYKPDSDYKITVNITNILKNGAKTNISYDVIFFDPGGNNTDNSNTDEETDEDDEDSEEIVTETDFDKSKDLSLIRKIAKGDLIAVQKLLVQRADPNAIYKGWSALMFASWYGQHGIAQMLLKKGADPDYNYQNWNSYSLAKYRKDQKMMNLLKDKTKKRDLKTRSMIQIPVI